MTDAALITNDAAVLAVLIGILAFVFRTSGSDRPFWRALYRYLPPILLCYFIPGVLGTLGVFSADESSLYFVASRYLLPASLVLFTMSMDVPAILRLGPRALILFFSSTLGVVIGGPLALFIVSSWRPELLGAQGADAAWRGMATLAGSWIGGAANQAALKEVFGASNDQFAAWIAVDVLVAGLWMAFLLYGAGRSREIDRWTGADTRAIEELQERTAAYHSRIARIPSTTDLMAILATGFCITGAAHLAADALVPWIARRAPSLDRLSLTSSFFWVVVIATLLGIVASFTRLRELEGAGASRIGTVLLYVLIATIGMGMDLMAVFESPVFFLVGFIWLSVQAVIVLVVGKLIRAPFFFVAVGSEANIGGAASAPVIASAFHPSLAPVGVLLAVLGYAIGTYGGWLTGIVMRVIAGDP